MSRIPTQVCLWSLITIFQALINGKKTFYITRVLLGSASFSVLPSRSFLTDALLSLFEGGLIPDMILLLSFFYTTIE